MSPRIIFSKMKIVILGPAHPYRGGIATCIENVAMQFTKDGHEVKIKTFTLQYPSFLFPGKSQTLDTPPPALLDIERCINSINPFNWIKVGRKLKKEKPDFILIRYWMTFMAPCLSTICRIARSNGHTKILCQLDNVEPHEKHFYDGLLNRYGLTPIDGFIYMSDQVNKELKCYTNAPTLFSPHPLFDNFGERVERAEACSAIGLNPEFKYALFFGLIRDYKGLDLLIEAWNVLKNRGKTVGKKLLVAGEFYSSREKCLALIEEYQLQNDIVLHDIFVPNEMVKYYFSAADFLVQPYKTATQSGVTQIAYQFYLPMIVTNVGGLAEIVPHNRVGYLCDTSKEDIAQSIEKIWQPGIIESFQDNMEEERKRFSWANMCSKTLDLLSLI